MAGQAGLDGGGFADNSNAFEGFNESSNQRVRSNLENKIPLNNTQASNGEKRVIVVKVQSENLMKNPFKVDKAIQNSVFFQNSGSFHSYQQEKKFNSS